MGARAVGACVVLGCAAGCFNPSPEQGLPCGPGGSCPTGQHCNAVDVCVIGDDQPDAPWPIDASPIDAVSIDADTTDAPPGTVTVTFGETGTATFANVTRDASLTDGSTMNDGALDHTSVEHNVQAGLYRFDVVAIPSTAMIMEVTLEVATNGDGQLLTAGSARIYRLTETWDEATVTFFERSTGVPWSAVGADPPSRDPLVLASIAPMTKGHYIISLPPSLVQGWTASAAANAGIIIDASTNALGHLHLGAREGAPANAALLSVSYVP